MTDGWTEVQGSNPISLGDKPATADKPAQREKAGGLLVKIEYDKGPKKNSAIYELVQPDGESLKVWGCVAIDRKLSPAKIGKFVRLAFKGIEQTKDGTDFKVIKVEVWDAPLTDKMKEWPRVEEFYTVEEGVAAMDGEDDDDLPF